MKKGDEIKAEARWLLFPARCCLLCREKKKAMGFVFGMIPPIVVLSYIAFYLSCFRNSVNQDANMFGAENL